MAKPARGVRIIAGILAALGVVAFLLLLAAPYLCFFLFPGIFFWVGRITIATGNDAYNTRLFWCSGAVWEGVVIGVYAYSFAGRPLNDFLQFAGMIALPLLSLALSLLVLFWLKRAPPTGKEISDTVQQDVQRYFDATDSGE